MTPIIPISSWSPDADPTTPGVLADVGNALPTNRGFAPDFAPAQSPSSPVTMSGRVYSAALLRFSTLTPCIVAATNQNLWSIYGGGAVNLNRVSGSYASTTNPTSAWRFAAFGDDALAVNASVTLQRTTSVYGTKFADVSGGPKAASIAAQSNFAMVGNTNGDSSWPYSDGWWCCALGDVTNWAPDVATQSARGRLTQTPGPIVRVIAYQNDLLFFKPTSVIRASYVGTPQIWSFTTVSTRVGLVAHDAVCEAGGILYWLAEDGFYRFNGGAIDRIASAPWRWWQTYGPFATYADWTTAVWDPVRRLVRWFYVDRDIYVGTADVALHGGIAYHPDTDRWGRFATNAAAAASSYREYVPMIDDPAQFNYVPDALCIFDVLDNKLKHWLGTAESSYLTTGDIGDDDGVYTLRRARARFISSPTTSSATHYTRMNLGDALVERETIARSDGKFDVTHSARWGRMKFQQTGMYELAGFSVDTKPGGTR